MKTPCIRAALCILFILHPSSFVLNVTDNDRGIDVDSTGSLIVKNSASGSTGGAANNYTIAAGNSDAAIETPGAGFTSTNPWANSSF